MKVIISLIMLALLVGCGGEKAASNLKVGGNIIKTGDKDYNIVILEEANSDPITIKAKLVQGPLSLSTTIKNGTWVFETESCGKVEFIRESGGDIRCPFCDIKQYSFEKCPLKPEVMKAISSFHVQ